MGFFSNKSKGGSPPTQGIFENERDYDDRVRQEGHEQTIADASGSAPQQGLFEGDADYRRRISREADENLVRETTGSAPSQGIFEKEQDYRSRVHREANERTIEEASGSAPKQGIFESEKDYLERLSYEAAESTIASGTGARPTQGILESERDYRRRIRREADEVRATRRAESDSSSSSSSSDSDWIKLVLGLLLLGVALAVIASPFIPIILLASASYQFIGGTAGAVVGLAIAGIAALALWKSRHFRAAYFFPYAFVVQGIAFLIFGDTQGVMWALGGAFVTGLLAYRGAFAAWRWRSETPNVIPAWLLAGAIAAGSVVVDAAVTALRPTLSREIQFALGMPSPERSRTSGGQSTRVAPAAPASTADQVAPELAAPAVEVADAGLYDGDWINIDADTRGIPRVVISNDGTSLFVHLYGACRPTNCDWGSVRGELLQVAGAPVIRAHYDQGFADRSVSMKIDPADPQALLVSVATVYKDASGRQSQVEESIFRRALVASTPSTEPAAALGMIEPYQPAAKVYVRGTGSRYRAAPYTTPETAILGVAEVGGDLDVIARSLQQDGYWYKVRLNDGREAFIRSDLTTQPLSGTAKLGPESSADGLVVATCMPTNCRDIWTTSVYSFAPGGGGPGGGLDNEELRVGGWGDEYWSLIRFELPSSVTPVTEATLQLYNRSDEAPTGMLVDVIVSDWGWPAGDRLWWSKRPQAENIGEAPVYQREGWVNLDITEIYNSWVRGDRPNYGIALRPLLTNKNFNKFISGNAEGETDKRPRIVVR